MNSSTILNVHDVVDLAIRTEQTGERFYREAAEIISDRPVKELFEKLAEDEVIHRKTFERMLSDFSDCRPPATGDGTYLAYLKDFLADNVVFEDISRIPELAKASSVKGALDFAIQREMDSILYYQEINMLMCAGRSETIDLIVDEERLHVASLSKLRRETTGV